MFCSHCHFPLTQQIHPDLLHDHTAALNGGNEYRVSEVVHDADNAPIAAIVVGVPPAARADERYVICARCMMEAMMRYQTPSGYIVYEAPRPGALMYGWYANRGERFRVAVIDQRADEVLLSGEYFYGWVRAALFERED